ncbi:tyrosine-type recombinase/integrase [Longispora albida]|uniref:tyrosine-type recombinase/integrase n=1 Tax=Longispora albida TaxID=203523 RepID=UPI0003A74122|nr:tyrosine-type recombinase/integrase [Longispora albida]
MTTSYKVKFWSVRKRAGRAQPWEFRWVVGGKEHSESFLTKPLAENFKSDLMRAAREGGAFDVESGLPETMVKKVSWYDHCVSYADMKWPGFAGKSRQSMSEGLTAVTVALLGKKPGRPDGKQIRHALYSYAFNPVKRSEGVPEDVAAVLAWVAKASPVVDVLKDLGVVRRVLDALTVRLDGKAAAATTIYRKRSVFYNALGYAVELGLLASNPVDAIQWKAPKVAEAVDRRVVANPPQVETLLTGVWMQGGAGEHLVAFFGTLYWAGCRPAEALELKLAGCYLPEEDGEWGRLDFEMSSPRSGADWTDGRTARDSRGLKHRSRKDVRPVPLPPPGVRLLRWHIARFGVAADGRLFRTASGGYVTDGNYASVWRGARERALTPAQAASPLAARPYDLRHGCASLMLNAGVPATEVARRLGQGVAVLMKVYANCVDGQEEIANTAIMAALTGWSGSGTLDAGDSGS